MFHQWEFIGLYLYTDEYYYFTVKRQPLSYKQKSEHTPRQNNRYMLAFLLIIIFCYFLITGISVLSFASRSSRYFFVSFTITGERSSTAIRFGIAIRAFRISAMSHTTSSLLPGRSQLRRYITHDKESVPFSLQSIPRNVPHNMPIQGS